MRTYVSTIGHYSPRVMRPILDTGLDAADTIVLLRPRNDTSDRAQDAIQDVQQTVRDLGPGSDVVIENVSYDAFDDAVREIVDVLEAASGDVIVNFDGGPREIFFPLAVAALARPNLTDTTLQFRDIDEEIERIDLPNLTDRYPDAAEPTLNAVVSMDRVVTLTEVVDSTGKSRSTVGRHLDALEEAGAVRTWMDGKTRHAEATLGGQLRA